MDTNTQPSSFDQELNTKVNELEIQRKLRAGRSVELTLDTILDRVQPRQDAVSNILSKSKSVPRDLRELLLHEICRAAEGDLLCTAYRERRKSEQRVIAYTGCCWEMIDQQLWQYFVNRCAERCGLPEENYKDPDFMEKVWRHTAFTVFAPRKHTVPEGEVWLNLLNGTLVIRRDGTQPELREHRRSDMMFYVLPYNYNPQAECPQWHDYLDRVLPESESQTVLAEFIGYTLAKTHILNKMLWMIGPGANGKSVALEIIEAMLGPANISNLSLSDLTNKPENRVGMEGKLLNISTETGTKVRADVAKLLTAGEPVTIKYLYEDPFTTRDYGQFMAAFNVFPRPEITMAFQRRLIVMPYDIIIPQEEQDVELTQKLKKELPGVLNRVIQAMPGLLKRKAFTKSQICQQALDQYFMQSDSVRMFYLEMCEKQEYSTRGDELFKAYKTYCYDSNYTSLGKGNFYKRLDQHTHTREDIGRVVYFHLKLVS
jgi:putative DNA primase/helicase